MSIAVINIIADIVIFIVVLILYAVCRILNRKHKETLQELEAVTTEKDTVKYEESRKTYQLCDDLNRVAKTVLDKLPKATESYKVSLEMKKAIIMYLSYFREYDEEYHWDITKVKPFTQDTTVAKEAKVLLNHIKEGSYDNEKDRVLQAIAYLILKA